MKKSILVILGLVVLPTLAQAEGVPGKSLGFGPEGDNSPAKIHVYIDSSDDAPTKREIQFRVLVDDRTTAYYDKSGSSMVISRIVIFNEGCSESEEALAESRTPYQTGKTLTSPARTEPFTVELPKEPSRSNEIACIFRFRLLAMKRKCMDTTPGCREFVIDTQGEFTSEDLKRLEPTDVQGLLIKQEK